MVVATAVRWCWIMNPVLWNSGQYNSFRNCQKCSFKNFDSSGKVIFCGIYKIFYRGLSSTSQGHILVSRSVDNLVKSLMYENELVSPVIWMWRLLSVIASSDWHWHWDTTTVLSLVTVRVSILYSSNISQLLGAVRKTEFFILFGCTSQVTDFLGYCFLSVHWGPGKSESSAHFTWGTRQPSDGLGESPLLISAAVSYLLKHL